VKKRYIAVASFIGVLIANQSFALSNYYKMRAINSLMKVVQPNTPLAIARKSLAKAAIVEREHMNWQLVAGQIRTKKNDTRHSKDIQRKIKSGAPITKKVRGGEPITIESSAGDRTGYQNQADKIVRQKKEELANAERMFSATEQKNAKALHTLCKQALDSLPTSGKHNTRDPIGKYANHLSKTYGLPKIRWQLIGGRLY